MNLDKRIQEMKGIPFTRINIVKQRLSTLTQGICVFGACFMLKAAEKYFE